MNLVTLDDWCEQQPATWQSDTGAVKMSRWQNLAIIGGMLLTFCGIACEKSKSGTSTPPADSAGGAEQT